MRVDQVMNFAWKFMLPDGVHLHCCRGHLALSGPWLRRLALVAGHVVAIYLALSRFLDTGKKFAPRTYRFAE